MGVVDLDSVTDELYALPPNEFTATRNERAKQARADGDRDLAERIRGLDKPTTAAWLVNQLTRELGDQLDPLLELGRDLREATSNVSGEELRALTRQRHEVVSTLVQQARRLGADRGTRVTESVAAEVQQTLDASLADPDVAEAVRSGRLTHSAEYAGFGEPTGGAPAGRSGRSASSGRTPGKAARKSGDDRDGKVADLAKRRRESAQRALADAEEALQDAQADHDSAVAESERAADEQQSAEERVEELRAELKAAQDRLRAAGQADRSARDRVRSTERTLGKAEQAREDAAGRLAELD